MSRDVPSDAGFLRDKDAIIGVAEQDILHVNSAGYTQFPKCNSAKG